MDSCRLRRLLPALAVLAAGATSLGGCAYDSKSSVSPSAADPLVSNEPAPGSATTSPAGTAAAVLGALVVKGRAPMTSYERGRFGQSWLDADRNGCDTRNDVLARDLTGRVYDPRTRRCVVLAGELADPYTRTGIHFVRGDGDLVDIDHVVALGNAWATVPSRGTSASAPLSPTTR